MTHRIPRLPLVLGLLAAAAAAQGRTWVVDSQNGPGTNFLDLAPAISAAAPGDRIQVRAGNYVGANVAKELTIVGEGGVLIYGGTLTVQGLPAGQQVVLSRLSPHLFATGPLVLANSQGRILVDQYGLDVTAVGGVQVTGCAHVQITRSRFTGGVDLRFEGPPAAEIGTSTVVVVDSVLTARDSFVNHAEYVGSVGLRVQNARVFLVRTQVTGGSSSVLNAIPGLAFPAVTATQSTIDVRGDATTVLRAGLDPRFQRPTPAVVADQGQVTIDPAVQLVSTSGAARITGTATVLQLPMPAMVAAGAVLGGVVNSSLHSLPGAIVVVVLGLPGAELPLGPEGSLWINPALFLVLAAGVQGSTGVFTVATPVPNDPSLRFGAFTQQGLSGFLATGFLLTNPASYTHF